MDGLKRRPSPDQWVATAPRHEEPDRVPFDFWAVPEVSPALRHYLDTDDDGDVLRLLGVDCRWVRPDYMGPAPIVQEDGSYCDALGTHRRLVSHEFCTYETYADGPAGQAQFRFPMGPSIDPNGNIYVADDFNHVIRVVRPGGEVLTLAGTGQAGCRDGPVEVAQFDHPLWTAIGPDGSLYVAGSGNNCIRKIALPK
jgi:hypothetical protein